MGIEYKTQAKLAIVGAACAVFASAATAAISSFVVDAGTQRTTNVQMIRLAIDILGKKEEEEDNKVRTEVLRQWAVSTINNVAVVQFDQTASELLISGEIQLATPTQESKVGGYPAPRKVSIFAIDGDGNIIE